MMRPAPQRPRVLSARLGARSGSGAWTVATLVIVGAAIQLLWMDPVVNPYDEAIVLVGADRVLHGDVPYRDFWTIYGPGAHYVLAGVFRVFGETAFVGRLLDIGVKSAIVAIVYLIAATFGRRAIALAAALCVLTLLVYLKNYGVPLFGSVAAGLAALALLRVAVVRERVWLACAGGGCAGIAVLYRYDVGLYAVAACAVFAWGAFRLPKTRLATLPVRHVALCFLGGLAALLVPTVAYFLLTVPIADLRLNLLTIPLQVYPKVRALPFPPIGLHFAWLYGALVYLPFLTGAVGLAFEVARPRDGRLEPGPDASTAFFRALLVLHVLYVAKGWVRVSDIHMGASLISSALLIAGVAARLRHPLAWRFVVAGCLVLWVAMNARPLLSGARDIAQQQGESPRQHWVSAAPSLCQDDRIPRLRCLRLDGDQAAVARFALARGSGGATMYVGAGRHDKLLAGNMVMYFAAAARPATRWHDLHPGVQTTLAVQQEIVRELEVATPRWVVIDDSWDEVVEPNASATSSGVFVLDEFLQSRYAAVFRSGKLSVLAPRPRAP